MRLQTLRGGPALAVAPVLREDSIENDAGGDGEVERVAAADHGNAYREVGSRQDIRRKSLLLATHQQGEGSRVLNRFVVGVGGVRGCGDGQFALARPGKELVHLGAG